MYYSAHNVKHNVKQSVGFRACLDSKTIQQHSGVRLHIADAIAVESSYSAQIRTMGRRLSWNLPIIKTHG
jgi:hypothetical protein